MKDFIRAKMSYSFEPVLLGSLPSFLRFFIEDEIIPHGQICRINGFSWSSLDEEIVMDNLKLTKVCSLSMPASDVDFVWLCSSGVESLSGKILLYSSIYSEPQFSPLQDVEHPLEATDDLQKFFVVCAQICSRRHWACSQEQAQTSVAERHCSASAE